MTNPYRLTDKRIIVTGASKGIGRTIAVHASNQGAKVTISARNQAALQQTLALMHPGDHQLLLADLAVENQINELNDNLPELDALVLNAGMIKTLPVQFLKKSVIDEMMQVNFTSSVMLIQQLLKQKKLKKGAAICFISSMATLKMHIGNAAYSATKAALNAYARSLALELAPKQIRVNVILPGMIQSDLIENSMISAEQLEQHKKNYPLGRYGTPDDVAHLAVFLLSDASTWMTGSLITLDGGYSLK